ncbi:MAG: ATP-grasp domain-containing protein [Alphaproteobacteria bacterium]|nr:ATP-grasp domain-containing protein [Alphaproteobacteria bacterium]
MSLLITSINNKRPMVSAFRDAAHSHGWRLYGSDLDLDVPAASDVDALIQLPAVTDPAYKNQLLKAVKENQVRLILPSRDGDIAILKSLENELAQIGCHLPLPSLETIEICQDKKLFSEKISELGFKAIPILNKIGTEPRGYFTRPRFASGSQGAYLVKSLEDAIAIAASKDQLLHPLILSPEYTIDILSDLAGTPLSAVCRRRLRVVNGESKWAQVEHKPLLEKAALGLAKSLKLVGHNILQAFVDKDQTPVFIECNLRFGGASILSLKAGLNTPDLLIRMVNGEKFSRCPFSDIKYGLSLKRIRSGNIETDHFSSNDPLSNPIFFEAEQ